MANPNPQEWGDNAPSTQRQHRAQRLSPNNPYLVLQPREMSVAYILWLLAGPAGAHRWYLLRNGSAKAMTILACTIVGLLVSAPWSLVDAFLIPGITREENAKLAEEWEAINSREQRESAEGGL